MIFTDGLSRPEGPVLLPDRSWLCVEMGPDRGCVTDGLVCRMDLATARATLLDRGLRFTNGIVFGPDDNLYVNETITGNLFRYPWEGGAIVPRRELVTNVLASDGPDVYKGPDG